MKTKEVIIEQQKDFIQEMKNKTLALINSIDKSEIETILLSGSVSRADFFPLKKENDEYRGHVDLIVMRKKGSCVAAEDIFGPDNDPPVPYHCIKVDHVCYAILFTDFIDTEKFLQLDEPRKFSVLESQILYDPNNSYKNELEKINQLGIGPGGLGGTTTALAVNINTYPTHIAGLPVAINICCHVNRHAIREI